MEISCFGSMENSLAADVRQFTRLFMLNREFAFHVKHETNFEIGVSE